MGTISKIQLETAVIEGRLTRQKNPMIDCVQKKYVSTSLIMFYAEYKTLKLSKLKVTLSQKSLEDFYIAKINISNHYPEQKI